MLPKHEPHLTLAPLPEELHRFLKERFPDNMLGASLSNCPGSLNGKEEHLADHWLTGQERLQLGRYTFEKRRQEWFLGRICAKQSVIDLLGSGHAAALTPTDISIEVTSSGRPFLTLPAATELKTIPEISISHSHDRVIAIAGNCPCGVDIQLMTDTLYKVRDRFCSDADLALLASTTEDELLQLGILWVAKEAIRKCLGGPHLVGFLEMHLNKISYHDDFRLLDFLVDGNYIDGGSVSAVVHTDADYCLGLCTLKAARSDA